MGTQQKLEWHFFDDEEANDQEQRQWITLSPQAALAPPRRRYRLPHLCLALALCALLLWIRPWQRNAVSSQLDQATATEPSVQGAAMKKTTAAQHRSPNLAQLVTEEQAPLPSGASAVTDDLQAQNQACYSFCSCVTYELPGCMVPQTLPGDMP
ncbi:MAG: hypothetical protein KDE19_04885 [Caldilineaceae bacterium]|nr:hypothetical protein [Caldilineaceae bacterium]